MANHSVVAGIYFFRSGLTPALLVSKWSALVCNVPDWVTVDRARSFPIRTNYRNLQGPAAGRDNEVDSREIMP